LVIVKSLLVICTVELTDRAVLTVLLYQIALLMEIQVAELLYHSVSAEVVLLIIYKLKDVFDKVIRNTELLCTILSYVTQQAVN
jgi:hypothetical protein